MTAYPNSMSGRPEGEQSHVRRAPPALIVAAWLFVGIPLLWGVSETFVKSLDLFRAPPQQTGIGTAPAPAPTAPDLPAQPKTTPATTSTPSTLPSATPS